MANEIILLSRSDIETLMPFGDYVEAVANAFRLQAEGQATSPPPLHIPAQGGGFHVKSASLPLGRRYVAIKTNANFPQNRRLRDLPTIQGAILLLDGDDGRPLAFLELHRDHHQAHRRRHRRSCPLSRASQLADRDDLRLRRAGPQSTGGAPSCPRYQARLRMG